MSLPAVSKHLRVLEKAGLLRRRRYGRVHEMQLEAKPLKQAAQWVEEYRKFWEGSLDRLAEYLEKRTKRAGKKRKRRKRNVSGLPNECGFDRRRRDVERRTDRFYAEQVFQKERKKQKSEENKMKLQEMEPETETNQVNLNLKQVPITKTGMLIRKPVADVFEAFINPDVTAKFWFTKAAAGLRLASRFNGSGKCTASRFP